LLRLAGPPPPPSETSQLVHGDLGSGNVLFAPGLAPAVIDFSPYWRPPGFAEAVVAGDAVVWHEAGVPLLRAVAAVSGPYFAPYLARAVIFRLATANERMRGGNFRLGDVDQEAARYRRAVRTLEDFTAQRA
jgi:hypothetical protein